MLRPPARRRRPLHVGSFAWLPLAACLSGGPTAPSANGIPFGGELTFERAAVRVFENVGIVDTENGTVSRNQGVLLRNGRIEAVGPAGSFAVPLGASVVDGGGAWLAPGLVDMHVHMNAADAEAYVRSGITTVRNMWGFANLASIVADIDSGRRIGPAIHTLSPGLDGPPVRWPETQLITDPDSADALVGRIASLGYSELKVYQDLSLEVYDAIVTAASKRGMTFAGHKPGAVPLTDVIQRGQRSIEHLGGYEELANGELGGVIELTVLQGTWVCPTLEIQRRMPGAAQGASRRRETTKALHDASARLLIGTDAGIGVTQPGLSLVEEIEELRVAGIPLPELLRIATVGAAEYLGLSDRIGRIAEGLEADLVLLSGNPLEGLDALRRPLGVHMGDGWIDMR
jgi:imidazolonepropionase-like amidohydrolase